MATATGVIDTAALVRSATWGGDIVRKAIVAHLDAATAQFDALTAEVERALALLQERRTALISAAVTGQIDVRAAT